MIDKTEEILERAKNGEYEIVEELLYGSEEHESTEFVIRAVIDSGRRVYVPEEDELFLDLDGIDALNKALKAKELYEIVQETSIQATYHSSKTTRHYHAVYEHPAIKDLSLTKKIYFQALFGSDPVKELLSKIRLDNEVTYPILLFNVPGLA